MGKREAFPARKCFPSPRQSTFASPPPRLVHFDCGQHRLREAILHPNRGMATKPGVQGISGQFSSCLVCTAVYRGCPGVKPAYTLGLLSAGYPETLRYEVRPDIPIGSWTWKVSWTAARKLASVSSFVGLLAEGQASDATIMSLACRLSRKMMGRYSHTRLEAKRSAISAIDSVIAGKRSTQFPPQSEDAETAIRQ
jgi:hypothetical protein